ncbi:hypothetical protein EDD37DRAFT_101562 [Exophiala viscosa]|uniref:uncharacterized protein n=1 Tax=Exophiala viscosa TaxID=2486360 RepID=UPI0021967C0E|nr:hypothetical protein EDD37DRAFT_101562 [Exophiala viscosa]
MSCAPTLPLQPHLHEAVFGQFPERNGFPSTFLGILSLLASKNHASSCITLAVHSPRRERPDVRTPIRIDSPGSRVGQDRGGVALMIFPKGLEESFPLPVGFCTRRAVASQQNNKRMLTHQRGDFIGVCIWAAEFTNCKRRERYLVTKEKFNDHDGTGLLPTVFKFFREVTQSRSIVSPPAGNYVAPRNGESRDNRQLRTCR